jgi:hypothetical protein
VASWQAWRPLKKAEESGLKLAVGVAMLLAVAPFGLPFENTWFSGFVAGIWFCGLFVAAIVSMPEPTEDSSKMYVWMFRFGHSLFHLGTAYFAHPSLWKLFKAEQGREREGVEQ